MTDIVSLLGADANSLLEHRCQKPSQAKISTCQVLTLLIVLIDNNRPNTVLRVLCKPCLTMVV